MDLTNLLIVKKFLGGSGSSESEILESYLDQWSLYANTKLEVAELPNITRLPDYAFQNQTKLVYITIPDSVTSISYRAFYGCRSLQSITIPDSVTSIGTQAFDDCTSLESIIIPDSVTEIGTMAFWGCSGLTSVTMGNGVTEIGALAFTGCTNLTTINVPWSEGAVSGAPWSAANATINYNYTGE